MFLWCLTQLDAKYQVEVKGTEGISGGEAGEERYGLVGNLGLLYYFSKMVDWGSICLTMG